MQLCQKKIGFQGEIKELAGDSYYIERLLELGFVRGAMVELCGVAPFGEPWIVKVRGGKVALRRQEAACIIV